jgi:hypothetical protein
MQAALADIIRSPQPFTTVAQQLNQGLPEIMSYIDFGCAFLVLFCTSKKEQHSIT